MDKKALSYIFEYSIDLPISFKCDYCQNLNESIHKIIKTHEEIVMVDKDLESYEFSNVEKDKIFNELEKKANDEINAIDCLYNKNNYSFIKDNKCDNCNKIASFSLKGKMKTKILLQIIIYIIIVFLSFILNIIFQNLMLALLNNVNNFFTSIYFYPSVFFVVCAIFFIFDMKHIKKEYKDNLPDNLSKPTIYKDKIVINKRIYLNPKEKR